MKIIHWQIREALIAAGFSGEIIVNQWRLCIDAWVSHPSNVDRDYDNLFKAERYIQDQYPDHVINFGLRLTR